jgi:FkbM family methyltransferase
MLKIYRAIKHAFKILAFKVYYFFSCLPLPFPSRLPWGDWWLSWGSQIDQLLKSKGFENSEQNLLEKLLKPGMVMIDAGANRGVYSLLASAIVGATGRVISFEPSLRERNWLRLHTIINRRKNIAIESFALGVKKETTNFFVTLGSQTGLNSLRYPKGALYNLPIKIHIITLDQFIEDHKIQQVDLIKMDIEGGERDALLGGRNLLGTFRPIIICELSTLRTMRWNYQPIEIVHLLQGMRYQCYLIQSDNRIVTHAPQENYEDNILAVPDEKTSQFAFLPPKE